MSGFYNPYGTEQISWSAASTDGEAESQKTYIGEYSDNESGLSYLNARYYTPETGQFLSQDPLFLAAVSGAWLLDPQLQNAYGYSRNNPVNYIDPGGEYAAFIQMGVGAGVLII